MEKINDRYHGIFKQDNTSDVDWYLWRDGRAFFFYKGDSKLVPWYMNKYLEAGTELPIFPVVVYGELVTWG